jgi:hypothetical protein
LKECWLRSEAEKYNLPEESEKPLELFSIAGNHDIERMRARRWIVVASGSGPHLNLIESPI